MKGTTDIKPFGHTAPGLVVPKLDVPMNGLTRSTGSSPVLSAALKDRKDKDIRIPNRSLGLIKNMQLIVIAAMVHE